MDAEWVGHFQLKDRVMKKALACVAGLVALSLVASAPARAEYPFTGTLPNKLFFFSLEGAYVFSGGTATQFSPAVPADVTPATSGRFAAQAGVMYTPEIDFAAGVSGTFFPSKVTTSGAAAVNNYGFYFSADLEAGYRMMFESTDLRFHGGLRGIWYHQNTDLTGTGTGSPANMVMGSFGVGPRVGVDAAHRIGNSPVSLVGGASASVLLGGLRQVGTITGQPAPDGLRFNTMLNGEAKAGLNVELTDNINLGVGYRVDILGNVDLANKTTATGGPGTGNSTRVFHGPYVTVSGSL